jgi:hypothetical protein
MFLMGDKAVASAAQTEITLQSVDYKNENLIVYNNDNKKIYFATETDATKENWEVVDVDDGDTTVIDFSWVSPATESILFLKGDDDEKQLRIILLPSTKKLEISIDYTDLGNLSETDNIAELLNIMTTSGNAKYPADFDDLEWKKSVSGDWLASSSLTVPQLEKFQIKGATLYFRIKPISDNENTVAGTFPDGSKGRRASAEVKLKIEKKSTPIVAGIDGSKFTAAIKYGKEYRVYIDGATVPAYDWVKVYDRAAKPIPLADIINNGSNGTTNPFEEMLIEIRDYSTAKKPASKISQIPVGKQFELTSDIVISEVPEDPALIGNNIYMSYNGNKNIILTVPTASTTKPYEYCIVKKDASFSLEKAVWTSITKNSEIKVLSSKATDGGTVYVRQKGIKSVPATKTTDAIPFSLASTYVTELIDYPSMPVVKKQSLTFTKNYSEDLTFEITLNAANKEAYETKISSIKLGTIPLNDIECKITPELTNPFDKTQVHVMTVTLKKDALSGLSNCYNRAISITFENGTTDKTSVKLTIQNPVLASGLTATPSLGSQKNYTMITVTNTLGNGNARYYTISDNKVENKYTMDKIPTDLGTIYDFVDKGDILITPNKYITVYETSADGYILKIKSNLITEGMINLQ